MEAVFNRKSAYLDVRKKLMENMNDCGGQLGTNFEVVVSKFVTFMRCPHRSPTLVG
jgi:hypothetical protein